MAKTEEERIILHSDLNSFYASVECMLNPQLRNKPVAVCGSTDDRHGIVLAKSELAKKAGVKTGQVTWQARRQCPNLITVPPQYEEYLKYSQLTKAIYGRYTDQIEPYGMDECWLDLTGSRHILGNGEKIANEIRNVIKEELGLTVSIGVSYNKIFAKLGSDMKKPDAVTVITRDNYRETVWKLPAADLLYVGRATEKKLKNYGIYTIGDLAGCQPDFLQSIFGKNGLMLWIFANGLDESRVMPADYHIPIKSIGHGITCIADLENNEEVWRVFLELSQDIGHKLRIYDLLARAVQITVKDNTLYAKQYQGQLGFETRSPMEIAVKAQELFTKNYQWQTMVRAVTVRAINLVPRGRMQQTDLFNDNAKREKLERAENAIEAIRSRFGKKAIRNATLLNNLKTPEYGGSEVIMPGFMYQ